MINHYNERFKKSTIHEVLGFFLKEFKGKIAFASAGGFEFQCGSVVALDNSNRERAILPQLRRAHQSPCSPSEDDNVVMFHLALDQPKRQTEA